MCNSQKYPLEIPYDIANVIRIMDNIVNLANLFSNDYLGIKSDKTTTVNQTVREKIAIAYANKEITLEQFTKIMEVLDNVDLSKDHNIKTIQSIAYLDTYRSLP